MSTRFREKMLIAKEYFIGIIISKERICALTVIYRISAVAIMNRMDTVCIRPGKTIPGIADHILRTKNKKGKGSVKGHNSDIL